MKYNGDKAAAACLLAWEDGMCDIKDEVEVDHDPFFL